MCLSKGIDVDYSPQSICLIFFDLLQILNGYSCKGIFNSQLTFVLRSQILSNNYVMNVLKVIAGVARYVG